MEERVLEVRGLSVELDGARVIDGLELEVTRGHALAVIGPNGAGKTVLFRALIGALPYTGTVRWAEGTRIGYVPQKLDIERDLPLTGEDFLHAKAAVSGASRAEVRKALDEVGLPHKLVEKTIGSLSGGQFQRLLVAFALVGRPTVLLFDEPTAGVDEPGEERLYELIRRVQLEEQLTVLLISHELNLVVRYADRVLCLSRHPPCYGPPDEVLTPERIEQMYGAPLRFHRHRGAGP
jgi:zinc transport system ATP-binding protein